MIVSAATSAARLLFAVKIPVVGAVAIVAVAAAGGVACFRCCFCRCCCWYGTDVLRCENNVLRFGLTLNKAIISASVGRPPSVGRRCCCRNRRHRGGCSWVRLAVEVV